MKIKPAEIRDLYQISPDPWGVAKTCLLLAAMTDHAEKTKGIGSIFEGKDFLDRCWELCAEVMKAKTTRRWEIVESVCVEWEACIPQKYVQLKQKLRILRWTLSIDNKLDQFETEQIAIMNRRRERFKKALAEAEASNIIESDNCPELPGHEDDDDSSSPIPTKRGGGGGGPTNYGKRKDDRDY